MFYTDGRGYCVIGETPTGSPILAHRVTMEKKLGRELSTDEFVHHIDGRRWNNCPFNLEVMLNVDHMRHHRRKWDVKRGNTHSNALLIRQYMYLWIKLGHRPRQIDLKYPSRFVYWKRFGGADAIVKLVNELANKEGYKLP